MKLLARSHRSLGPRASSSPRRNQHHLGNRSCHLGEPSARLSEAANSLRIAIRTSISALRRHLGLIALVTPARLHHRLPTSSAPPRGHSRHLPPCLRTCALTTSRTNANIHLVLGDINARDDEIILCHTAPSLLGSGLKSPALSSVRKDTGSVPLSPPGSKALRARTVSDPATAVVKPPFPHSGRFCGPQRARRKP